jgi:glycosyltransferase involved in cell wall biosynthesis
MLTVLTVFLDGEMSGTPRRIFRISKYLNRSRFRSVVVIPKADGEFAALLRGVGVTVYEIEGLARPRRTTSLCEAARWIGRFLPDICQIRRVIAEEGADIVHCYGMSQVTGPLACLGLGTKVVWHINDDSVPPYAGRPFVKVMRMLSDRITVSSHALADRYMSLQNAQGAGFTDVLYSTVDLDAFQPTQSREATRRELGISSDEVVVGMVGNVARAKGQHEFVRAAAMLRGRTRRRLRFLMAGRTLALKAAYALELDRLIERLGIGPQVIKVGYRNDVPNLLDGMDVLVVPSLWEPLGVIVMEGMAMKKAMVATDAGGIPEMLRDGREALLVPPSAPAAIAAAVELLIQSPDLARRLAEAASARLKSAFAPEAAAAKYERLYTSLIGEGQRRPVAESGLAND